MHSFISYTPTKVIFGSDARAHLVPELEAASAKRVFLIYGGGSAVKSGLIGETERALADGDIACLAFGGVQPNPTLAFARKAAGAAAEFGADFILAVGGGSVIDTAKAVADALASPGVDIWDLWLKKTPLTKALPVGVILTIPAAGSEMSDSAVLTNTEEMNKRGLSSPHHRPRFALMDPALCATLPPYQVACGVVDIMMHTLDRYFNPTEGNDLTDELAEALLRVVIRHGPAAVANPADAHAMSELMWCGSLSHNGLTGLGAVTDFAPHQLGHALSARFGVAHGASLSAIWDSWARYDAALCPARFARYAKNVWGIDGMDERAAAEAGIERTAAYFRSLQMPTCFTALGIGVQTDDMLDTLATDVSYGRTRTIGSLRVLGYDDIRAVYVQANR